jgi:hypothetical protein
LLVFLGFSAIMGIKYLPSPAFHSLLSGSDKS